MNEKGKAGGPGGPGRAGGGARRGRLRAVGTLVDATVRKTTGARGFAESKLLTHWAEVAGPDIAAICRPVKVAYSRRGGVGAALTLLTTGAHAPVLQMRLPALRERVNACYGYAAIGRIDVTQTAPTGFGPVEAPAAPKPMPTPEARRAAERRAASVGDPGLRAALERLGANIISATASDVPDGDGRADGRDNGVKG